MNGKSAANHGECLSEECLTDYLEGTLDPVVRSACDAHLVACDPCRENLALFMKMLQEDIDAEEEAALQQLSAIWEDRKLRPVPAVRRRRNLSLKHLGFAAAGIAALLLVAFFIARPFGTSPSKTTQFAEALINNARPFEPRIVGQPYREIEEKTRGPEAVIVPDALVAEMTEKSADFYEVGRVFLLRKEYAKAIKYLKAALADPKGIPADLHNDLGVALLESGEQNFAAAEA